MKFIACPSGSPEWLQARAGAITASMFATAISTVGGLTDQQQKYVDAILAGATEEAASLAGGYKAKVKRTETVERAILGLPVGEPSDGSKKYAGDLAIERISGKPYGEPIKTWVMERGHEMEAKARMLYEARSGFMAMEGGIFKTDDDWFGYSSDGAVDATPEGDGLIEVKAPVDTQKIVSMWKTSDVSEYIHQMQGGMWITGRKWCDLIMYVPDLAAVGKDLYVKRIYRDDDFINDMVEKLMGFRANVMVMESFFRKPMANLDQFQQAA
jgi:hypothetical protein